MIVAGTCGIFHGIVLGRHQGRTKPAEWVQHPVARIGEPLNDKLSQFERKAEEIGPGKSIGA